MTTTQPDLELVVILKRLGLRTTWGEEYDTHYDALWNAIRWICERTGLDQFDLDEAAYRLNTDMGLAPWRKSTGDKAEYRDLRSILPKLKELDRDGSTARLIAERPDIAQLVNLPSKLSEPSEGRPPSGATKEDMAMAVLTRHPDWTMTKIAEAAGCSRTSLNRMGKFQNLRRLLAYDIPRGEKDAETGTIEAF